MAKAKLYLWLGLLVFLLESSKPQAQDSGNLKWVKRVVTEKETITNLQFYFHDILGGSNPTAARVAQANDTNQSPTNFGAITMVDDPLTEEPDLSSKLIGRAQGLYGSSGQSEMSLIMVMSFSLLDGIYKGSSFVVLGRNLAMSPQREIPIVGGTGLFRMARGYAVAQSYSVDPNAAVVSYNVTISVDGNQTVPADGTSSSSNNKNSDVNSSGTTTVTFLNHASVAIFAVLVTIWWSSGV
ncbi:hypothetical protein K2173_012685 [Erythroxylum novogranatense]|uniref:Dirigent protein n=1 Tax=Erythroxylum novogranatense TaxID=1862640 RepID=A0AAV8TLS3_9ROSI|nr:hypothetical protein K2173_012685 [Erythroxylum novogranatense]